VHQQRHAAFGHGFEHGVDAADVGHTGVGIGGRPGPSANE
jgi:hypothetical protein